MGPDEEVRGQTEVLTAGGHAGVIDPVEQGAPGGAEAALPAVAPGRSAVLESEEQNSHLAYRGGGLIDVMTPALPVAAGGLHRRTAGLVHFPARTLVLCNATT